MTSTSSAPPTAEPADPAAPTPGALSRRAVVAGAGVVAGVGLLAACGGGTPAAAPAPAPAPAEPAPSAASDAGSGASAGASSGQALAKATTVPVGGGTIFADQNVVVTQPTPGDFKAFSATCTHQGCKVNKVADGTINCPCHGSKFNIADGSVAHGPAQKPLPAKSVSVNGDEIVLA